MSYRTGQWDKPGEGRSHDPYCCPSSLLEGGKSQWGESRGKQLELSLQSAYLPILAQDSLSKGSWHFAISQTSWLVILYWPIMRQFYLFEIHLNLGENTNALIPVLTPAPSVPSCSVMSLCLGVRCALQELGVGVSQRGIGKQLWGQSHWATIASSLGGTRATSPQNSTVKSKYILCIRHLLR